MPALAALLDSLIDYAGLFPPAKLAMPDTVRQYAAYRRGPHAAWLGRLVVPVARLAEFETELAQLSAAEQPGWRLTAVVGTDPVADSRAVHAFNLRQPHARIVSVETKAATPAEAARLATAFTPGIEIWIEIPTHGDVAPLISAISTGGVGAKIRTGGVTPDAFPPATDIARFMQACHSANVIFKATAGLHHPLGGSFPLTYEAGSAHGTMFGFLNIFLAAALVQSGGSPAEVVALLGENDARKFALSTEAIAWEGHRVTTDQLTTMRKRLCRSFGSCSFTEPIDGLRQLTWL